MVEYGSHIEYTYSFFVLSLTPVVLCSIKEKNYIN